MKLRLNNTVVDQLAATDKPIDVWDTERPGLYVRVHPTGRKSLRYRYRFSGKQRHKTLGRFGDLTVAQARELAKDVAIQSWRGEDPVRDLADPMINLRKFIDEKYKEWAMANQRTAHVSIEKVEHSFAHLLHLPLCEINSWQIESWRVEAVRNGKKKSTVNRTVNALKGILRRAVDWGFLQENPLKAVKNLKEDDNQRVRFLSEKEEGRLMAALKARSLELWRARNSANEWRAARNYQLLPQLRPEYPDFLEPMVLLAMFTGLRRGELFSLQWGDVDFEERVITVRGENAKNFRSRRVNLSDQAINVLMSWKLSSSSERLVFTNGRGNKLTTVKKSFSSILKAAGIENFRFHDLRHHFASRCAMQGVKIETIQAWLGHRHLDTTMKYAHLSEAHKSAEIEKLSSYYSSQVSFLIANS